MTTHALGNEYVLNVHAHIASLHDLKTGTVEWLTLEQARNVYAVYPLYTKQEPKQNEPEYDKLI